MNFLKFQILIQPTGISRKIFIFSIIACLQVSSIFYGLMVKAVSVYKETIASTLSLINKNLGLFFTLSTFYLEFQSRS